MTYPVIFTSLSHCPFWAAFPIPRGSKPTAQRARQVMGLSLNVESRVYTVSKGSAASAITLVDTGNTSQVLHFFVISQKLGFLCEDSQFFWGKKTNKH